MYRNRFSFVTVMLAPSAISGIVFVTPNSVEPIDDVRSLYTWLGTWSNLVH